MGAPRGFPTLLPATNDNVAGEVILHKVTQFLDLGDVMTTALRYFGAPVTLLYDPYAQVAYIVTDSDDRASLISQYDGEPFREIRPVAGQTGAVLQWEWVDSDSDPTDLLTAVNMITEPQIVKKSVGAVLNSVHLAANAFSVVDQPTGNVRFFVPADLAEASERIADIGLTGAGKRVVVKLNPPTAALF